MFVFPAGLLIEELSRHAPEILTRVEESLGSSLSTGNQIESWRIELGPEFAAAPDLSIDVAVMEPTDRGAVVSLDAGWNDVGSWESLWELSEQDPTGNVIIGEVVALESSRNYLRSDGPLIAVIGIEGLVVVATDDAVLVVPRDRAQDVKSLVEVVPPKNK
jgi:mannose-1-phosphate guanylyltransferase